MFHRVKSEGPDQQAQQTQQASQTGQAQAPQSQQSVMQQRRQPEFRSEVKIEVADFSATQNNQPQNPFSRADNLGADMGAEAPQNNPSNPSNAKDSKTMNAQDNSQAPSPTPEERDVSISTYQRAGTAPVRTPVSTYPASGGYAATGYGIKHPEHSASPSTDRRLTIGAGITMSGEIESCDYLLVEGTVEAALKGASVLDIAESGVFYGTVDIGEANIAGRFEGDIVVQGRLTISSTGTVMGSISYKELEIESGGVIDGRVTPLSGVVSTQKKPLSSKGKFAKESKADHGQNASHTNEGELFSKAAAAE